MTDQTAHTSASLIILSGTHFFWQIILKAYCMMWWWAGLALVLAAVAWAAYDAKRRPRTGRSRRSSADPARLLLGLRADRLKEFEGVDREHYAKAVGAILAFGDAYQVSFSYDRATPGHVRLLFEHRERAIKEMRDLLMRLPNDTGLETRLRAYIDWVNATTLDKIEDVKKRCASEGTMPVPLEDYHFRKHYTSYA